MSTSKSKVRKRAARTARAKQPARGRRFSAEDKRHALDLISRGRTRAEVAAEIGTSVTSVTRWEAGGAERRNTSASSTPPPTAASAMTSAPAKGRRFTLKQRKRALELVAAGMKRTEVAETIGTTTESIRRWQAVAEHNGTAPTSPPAPNASPQAATEPVGVKSPYAPKDPGQGLGAVEQAAILELKKKHPSMGPAQIRAQLKRFKRWRLSIKAIARVLRAHGYEPVRSHGRPVGPQPVRFEAPHRNALWQLDFAELRVGGERQQLLVVLDDFSRYCVGHVLSDGPSAEAAIEALRAAIARHGKPEAVRTDPRRRVLVGRAHGLPRGRAHRPRRRPRLPPRGWRQGRVAHRHHPSRALGRRALRRLDHRRAPARHLGLRVQRVPGAHGDRRAHARPLHGGTPRPRMALRVLRLAQ